MTGKSLKFYNYLKSKNLDSIFDINSKDGYNMFTSRWKMESAGTNLNFFMGFDEERPFVEIILWFQKISNSYKKDSILRLMNELNKEMSMGKYYINNENEITYQFSTVYDDLNSFNPESLHMLLIAMFNGQEQNWAKFMRELYS